jgi:hypothetical protein
MSVVNFVQDQGNSVLEGSIRLPWLPFNNIESFRDVDRYGGETFYFWRMGSDFL